jgi:hypothetical protein
MISASPGAGVFTRHFRLLFVALPVTEPDEEDVASARRMILGGAFQSRTFDVPDKLPSC